MWRIARRTGGGGFPSLRFRIKALGVSISSVLSSFQRGRDRIDTPSPIGCHRDGGTASAR